MIRIEASNQAGTEIFNLDVQETPVEFNYSVQELRDISNVRSPHSLRFNMPMTDNNNKFFGQYYNVNFDSESFDAGVKTNVQVFDAGVPIMVGVLQLHSVTKSLSKYEVSVLAEVASFYDAVKDLSFSEIFITSAGLVDTDLDHALTAANITTSWDITNDITTGAVGAGVIVYPLSDWGLNVHDSWTFGFHHSGSATSNNGMGFGTSSAGGQLAPQCFKPAIRINWLLNRIAQKAGFTISSDFLTNDVSNLYMFLATEVERAIGRPVYGARVGLEGNFVLPTGYAQTFIPLTNETAPNNDVDATFLGGTFVAPMQGIYHFQAQAVVTANTIPDTGDYDIGLRLIKNYAPLSTDNPLIIYGESYTLQYGGTFNCPTDVFSVSLDAGETLSMFIKSSSQNQVQILENSGDNYTFLTLLSYTSTGTFVDVSENFPDMKVGEFLTEIFNRFNLVIYSYPDSPTVLYVEPYNDVLDSTSEKYDWTDKIDADTIIVSPTTKFQKKSITFEDGEGKDWKNDWWQKHYGYVKGRWIYENDNEFAVGNQRIGGGFQPLRLATIPQSFYNSGGSTQIPNVLVPRLYDAGYDTQVTKELVEAKPILAFYHGKKDIGNNREFRVGGYFSGSVDVSQYPFFSEYNTSPVTTNSIGLSWALNWGSEQEHPLINEGDTPGVSNLHCFRKFWARRLYEEYSGDSRFMTCEAYLTPLDIHRLKWNDEIFIDNCWWRVVKVSNFSTGQVKPAKLELLKVIQASAWNKTEECGSYPASFNVDGTVNFVDLVTGASVSPTEACCTNNGFIWDNTNSVCFWSSGTSGGGSPNGGGTNPYISDLKNANATNVKNIIGGIADAQPKSITTSNDLFASKQSFQMSCKTTDAANTSAKTAIDLDEFLLEQNSVYLVNVDIITVETGGTSGTPGDAMTMRYQGTIANKAGTSRSVGQTLISSEADAGAARSITINQKQDATGRISTWELLCRGEVNKNISWILDVEILQLSYDDIGELTPHAVWNKTNDPLIYLNTASSQYLAWNL
jgi:hypothetical protein